METSRKKALEIMQKGIVLYQLLCDEWTVGDHLGDGCDLIAEKTGRFVKIELKAIDLDSIKSGKNATQYVSANEIVTATHLVITVFKGITMKDNYIMSMRQFVENSGVKKYREHKSFKEFIETYKKLSMAKSKNVKNYKSKIERLDFDLNFNPLNIEKWKIAIFKDHWEYLEL